LEGEHNFRCSVPAGCDIFRHVPGVLFGIIAVPSCETEVADFELAVGVDEEVTGFQVPVEDIGGVDVFHATEDLVDEGLVVGICERLS
jgi:hypothetical protein